MRRLGGREALHLEFIELVHADNPFHIFPICSRLSAETRRISEVSDWHIAFFENFIGMHGTEHMFGRALEPEILSFDLVALLTRLETIHSIIWRCLDHVGWQNRSEWLVGNLESIFRDNIVKYF